MNHFLSKRRTTKAAVEPPFFDVEKGGAGNAEKGGRWSDSFNLLQIRQKRKSIFGAILRFLRNLRLVLEDWLFLALLGILVALCSLAMDLAIEYLQTWHIFTIELAKSSTHGYSNIAATYSVWTGYAILLVISSTCFVRLISPQAIGSGIPEMKTILRGVLLKEYLTLRTLISKMIGLTLSLGSGMPIGKEGPFVHIASVVSNLLSQCVHSVQSSGYANESRSFEMLAAACAVGVSSTFSAPVGGVLFSIEVTSVYFAVRNYWRGFFAATCSATLFRIFRVLLNETEVTVTAFYQTQFPRDAFFPEELPVFAMVGVFCGFASAAFICLQRRCILFLRRNKFSKFVFQQHWAIYPALIAFLVGSLTYPEGFGRFLGGEKKFMKTAKDFFADCTWSLPQNATRACPPQLLASWMREDEYGIFTSLSCFIGVYFLLTILTSTLPIPSGIFGPSFVLGAAVGRLVGEIMVLIFPEGLHGTNNMQIFPGVYSIVGSAAFTGGVTHTVSVAVIVFELTGQLLHILPVMIAVLISNAISSYLQPSIYDSAIRIKHLPYLPDIPATSVRFHGILVKQFMTQDVQFFSKSTSYRQLQETLFRFPRLKAFPIVENEKSRILIGSCSRSRLLRNLNSLVGPQARQQEANSRRAARIGRRKLSFDQQMAEEEANKRQAEQQHQQLVRTKSDTIIVSMSETPARDREESANANGNNNDKNYNNNLDVEEGNGSAARFKVLPLATPVQQPQRQQLQLAPTIAALNQSCPLRADGQFQSILPVAMGVKRSLTTPSLNNTSDVYSTIGDMIRTLTRFSHILRKSHAEECDLEAEERNQWENTQLAKTVDFDGIGIDPAPFQLVEQTSLFKVHSLFSMLGLNRAYVTNCGSLVGVVALRDLREAVERIQLGLLTAKTGPPPAGIFSGNGGGGAAAENDEEVPAEEANLEEEEQQPKTDPSTDDEDGTNDILNPRLQVVSRADSMYGKDSAGASTGTEPLRVRHQMKKASDAFRGFAVDLLTKGMLQQRRDSSAGSEEAKRPEEPAGPVLCPVADQQPSPSSIPIFVISSSEDDLREGPETEVEEEETAEVEEEEEKPEKQAKTRGGGDGQWQQQKPLDANASERMGMGNNNNSFPSNRRLGPAAAVSVAKSPSCLSSPDRKRSPQRRVRVVSPSASPNHTTGLNTFEFPVESSKENESAPAS